MSNEFLTLLGSFIALQIYIDNIHEESSVLFKLSFHLDTTRAVKQVRGYLAILILVAVYYPKHKRLKLFTVAFKLCNKLFSERSS